MKITDAKGFIHQLMHAVFEGEKQLTAWRTCKVSTLSAMRRGSQWRARKLTLQSKFFTTPPREKGVSA
jgi:hypothetical protein